MFCEEWSLLKRQGVYLSAEPLRCKRWSCEECAPRRKTALRALGRTGNPNTFLTLTVRPKAGQTPSERAQALVKATRTMWRRARAKYGYRTIPFLAIFETTKRGEPHLHILARCKWIDQEWLSNQMAALIGAPIVDIRRIVSQRQMINYVTKYIAKQPSVFKGCKRYWYSKDWKLPDPEAEEERRLRPATFEVFRGSLRDLAEHLGATHHMVWLAKDSLSARPWTSVLGELPP